MVPLEPTCKTLTMVVAVDHLVNARESSAGLDRAIEMIISTMGRFNGRNVMSYLKVYKAKILMWGIPEDKRLSGFAQVVMQSIHA